MEKRKNLQIAVIGSSEPASEYLALAYDVGRIIASKGAVLVCGGLGGIMEAAAQGAKEKGGLTLGIIPDYDKQSANPFIDVVIPSGLGHARNILVAASGDLVVALPGSNGTRAEVSIALKLGKPVIGLLAWETVPGVQRVNSVQELESILLPYF